MISTSSSPTAKKHNILINLDKSNEKKISGEDEENNTSLPVLDAKIVYILMSKDHRISRNRRAEWFFSRFDTIISLPQDHLIALALVSNIGIC